MNFTNRSSKFPKKIFKRCSKEVSYFCHSLENASGSQNYIFLHNHVAERRPASILAARRTNDFSFWEIVHSNSMFLTFCRNYLHVIPSGFFVTLLFNQNQYDFVEVNTFDIGTNLPSSATNCLNFFFLENVLLHSALPNSLINF